MSALSGAGVSSDGSTCRSSEHLVCHAKNEKKRELIISQLWRKWSGDLQQVLVDTANRFA